MIDCRGMGISGTSEIVTYEALSYSWGNPSMTCSIVCNEKPFGPALELATALQYLRTSSKDRYIWCDAICINQLDLFEKGLQVKNMLRIFEKAELVAAWLGQSFGLSGQFFRALQLVGDNEYRISSHALDESSSITSKIISEALRYHISSAWFVRTWVKQEVFAAKKLDIQIGPYRLDFDTFLDNTQKLQILCNLCVASDNPIKMPPTLQVYQQDYQHRGAGRLTPEIRGTLPTYVQHWKDVLRSGCLFKVTDERDRIYGALGLLTSASVKLFARLPASPEILPQSFPINYNKMISEVYQDVIKFLINIEPTTTNSGATKRTTSKLFPIPTCTASGI